MPWFLSDGCKIVLIPFLDRPKYSKNGCCNHSNKPDHSGDGEFSSSLKNVLEAMKRACLAVLDRGPGNDVLQTLCFIHKVHTLH